MSIYIHTAQLHFNSHHTLIHTGRWTNTRHMHNYTNYTNTVVLHRQIQPQRWPLTCDEVAKLCIEAGVVIRAGETRYNVISRDALLQGDIVHTRVEGRRLIVNVQNWWAHAQTHKSQDVKGNEQMYMRTKKGIGVKRLKCRTVTELKSILTASLSTVNMINSPKKLVINPWCSNLTRWLLTISCKVKLKLVRRLTFNNEGWSGSTREIPCIIRNHS